MSSSPWISLKNPSPRSKRPWHSSLRRPIFTCSTCCRRSSLPILSICGRPQTPRPAKAHTEQALRERLADSKFAGINLHVAFGEAGHEIAGFAQTHHADLIVLPSHGRTGLSRLLIGSTAERVVRLAHCPVLVLRK
ncbi:MAG: universal stress protein [Pirellulales bacterium]